jgi:glycosyltransferase involved in cell wall biosynthesis
MSDSPRVSIGLPVYNGERYLQEALDSILAQTYTNFELIISDNASTDRTKEICLSYADKDNRIRYFRTKTNVGASKNFNRIVPFCRGEYFRWVAHDDVLHPEFLKKCVNVLDADPSVVVCCSKTRYIDQNSQFRGTHSYAIRIDSRKPHERFGDIISLKIPCAYAIFGLIRLSLLKKTPLLASYIGSDRNLTAELGLMGRIYEIPEYLFYSRDHPETCSRELCDFRSGVSYHVPTDWWDPTLAQRIVYTYNFLEYLRSINRVSLTLDERFLCYIEVLKWFVKEGWMLLGNDVEMSLLNRTHTGRRLTSVFHSLIGQKLYKRLR